MDQQEGGVTDFILGIFGIIVLLCFVAGIIYLFSGGLPTIKIILKPFLDILTNIFQHV